MNLVRQADTATIAQLKQQIASMQQNKKLAYERQQPLGLGMLENSFPGAVFPQGAVHELVSASAAEAASANAFTGLLLSKLMQGGYCVWVGNNHALPVYPPALAAYCVAPERVIFMDTRKTSDTLWVMEEALKCHELAAVVGEVSELSFNESRRLQLAVEKSGVTGFIHRLQPRGHHALACVSRWNVAPVAGNNDTGMPGLDFPSWRIRLLKARNGQTGEWLVQYKSGELQYLHDKPLLLSQPFTRQTA